MPPQERPANARQGEAQGEEHAVVVPTPETTVYGGARDVWGGGGWVSGEGKGRVQADVSRDPRNRMRDESNFGEILEARRVPSAEHTTGGRRTTHRFRQGRGPAGAFRVSWRPNTSVRRASRDVWRRGEEGRFPSFNTDGVTPLILIGPTSQRKVLSLSATSIVDMASF